MKKINIMNQNTVTRAYVYLMLTFFLFFTGFEGYRNIFDSKCVVFTALSIVYIVVSFVFGLKKELINAPQKLALIYLAVTAVSSATSVYFPRTLVGVSRYEGLLTVGIYVTVFLLVSQSWVKGSSFIPVLSGVGIAQSAVVLLQLLGFNALWLFPEGVNYYIALEKYNGAFISTVGNADISSAFFALIVPVLWILVFAEKRYRLMTLLSAVMSTACLILMSVSAGVVALVITVAVLPFVIFEGHRKITALITVAVVVVALAVLCFLPLTEGTLFELQSLIKGKPDSDFGSGRLHIWSEALKNLKHPFGTGPDTMLLENIEPFTKTVNGQTITRKIDIAHNDYLNILFHQGAFALIAYLGMLGLSLAKWIKNGRKNLLVTALGAGVFSYCVQVFFSYSACSSAIFFWIFLGMLEGEAEGRSEGLCLL